MAAVFRNASRRIPAITDLRAARAFEQTIGFRPPRREWLGRASARRAAARFYLGRWRSRDDRDCVSPCGCARRRRGERWTSAGAARRHRPIPAIDVAAALVNRFVISRFGPAILPAAWNFDGRRPPICERSFAVPALLTTRAGGSARRPARSPLPREHGWRSLFRAAVGLDRCRYRERTMTKTARCAGRASRRSISRHGPAASTAFFFCTGGACGMKASANGSAGSASAASSTS